MNYCILRYCNWSQEHTVLGPYTTETEAEDILSTLKMRDHRHEISGYDYYVKPITLITSEQSEVL